MSAVVLFALVRPRSHFLLNPPEYACAPSAAVHNHPVQSRVTLWAGLGADGAMAKLNALKVKRLVTPGRYGDGAGLYLQVRGPETRSWLFRFMLAGRAREMGLGAEVEVSLAHARELAQAARRLLRQGVDPLEHRRQQSSQAAGRGMTLRAVADLYIAAHESSWRNAVHRLQWRTTLDSYVMPKLGNVPVAVITTGGVLEVLEPIWREKPETAGRVRGRIEALLDYAKARGWRDGENPARWRGHLANLLPARNKIARVQHHPALPWQEIGAFMEALRSQAGVSALALRFVILTAARTGEVIGATWGEIDLRHGVWTVPGERMKASREHRVPLPNAASQILRQVEPMRGAKDANAFVFPGAKPGLGLSAMAMLVLLRRMNRADLTTHGFRSTFRDWCAESTNYPREVAEAALAHTLSDKVEAAYRRGDLFEKRRRLMEDWAEFCARPATQAGDVVSIRA